MKAKTPFLLLTFLILFVAAFPAAYARTRITGMMEGQNFGFLHMDANTAKNNFPACITPDDDPATNPNCTPTVGTDAYYNYFLGDWGSFFIDVDDPAPENDGPGSLNAVASISELNEVGDFCDNTDELCRLHGYVWSEKIGWTVLDGQIIQDEIPGGAAAFPEALFSTANYYGFFNGFAWSDKAGWIRLSACTGQDNPGCGTLSNMCEWNATTSACQMKSDAILPEPQTSTQWGVYLDFEEPTDLETADCEVKNPVECASAAPACVWDGVDSICEFNGTPRGRSLHGLAWSEKLGWIKFSSESSQGDTYNFAAETMWIPDLTPPLPNLSACALYNEDGEVACNADSACSWNSTYEFCVPDDPNDDNHFWFANNSAVGAISWPFFGTDPESGVDIVPSFLVATLDSSPDFAGCNADDGTGVPGAIDANLSSVGYHVAATIPLVGSLNTVPAGFCKYTLTGKLFNNTGFPFYVGDPDDELLPAEEEDPNLYREPVTFYVRAGNIDYATTTLSAPAGSSVADGHDVVQYTFGPKDVAGNPIVPVRVDRIVTFDGGNNIVFEGDSDDWMRDVQMAFNFDANSTFFDTVDPLITPDTIPVRLSDIDPESAGLSYSRPPGTISYPQSGPDTLLPTSLAYPIMAVAYSPTTTCGASCLNDFIMSDIEGGAIDGELPAITTFASPTSATSNNFTVDGTTIISGSNPLSPDGAYFAFTPALNISAATISPPTSSIVLGQPLQATFTLENYSPTETLDYLAFDNNFNFSNVGGSGYGSEVLDMVDISLITPADPDGTLGRMNPFPPATRYQVLRLSPSGVNDSVTNTVFHDDTSNFHSTNYAFFSDYLGTPTTLNSEAVYTFDIVTDNLSIDRSDSLNIVALTSGATSDVTIGFTPVQHPGATFEAQVEFDVSQYVAYRPSDSPFSEFAVFEAPPLLTGFEVKNVGLGTTGIISGEKVFETVGGRTLETVSAAASADLQRSIRSNVATLTRNMTPCAVTTLNELSTTPSGCIRVDTNNNTVVAFYSGTPGQLLTFGDATGTITTPDNMRYTVIVEGGASIFLRDNLVYGNNSSFGLIALQNDSGLGANVYLDPAPTNMAGLLYAEGSLLSSPDGGALYYGSTGQDANGLINQLYWVGAIASRNTIGGGPNEIIPQGITCPSVDPLTCAQRYDLDYIRRFAVLNASPSNDYSKDGALFSGGGSCTGGTSCALGLLPTTITLNGSNFIDVSASVSVDPFFVERDSRPAPPGFTTGGGFTQSRTIR